MAYTISQQFQTGEWVTWAGNCNTQSCGKAFLNGTTVVEMSPGVDFSSPADAR
jgi:hypothetical protein